MLKIIFLPLILILLSACNTIKFKCYQDAYTLSSKPSMLITKDSLIYIKYDNGNYLTGRYTGSPIKYKIILDSVPLNNSNLIKYSFSNDSNYKFNDSIQINFINNSCHFNLVYGSEKHFIPIKGNHSFKIHRNSIVNPIHLNLYYTKAAFDLFAGDLDSTIVKLPHFEFTQNNVIKIDCKYLYLFEGFKNKNEYLSQNQFVFSENMDTIIIQENEFHPKNYSRSKQSEKILKNRSKTQNKQIPEEYFINLKKE